jgi:hypothetical protein
MSEIQRVLVTGPTGKVGQTFIQLFLTEHKTYSFHLSKTHASCAMSFPTPKSIQALFLGTLYTVY